MAYDEIAFGTNQEGEAITLRKQLSKKSSLIPEGTYFITVDEQIVRHGGTAYYEERGRARIAFSAHFLKDGSPSHS